MAYGHGRDVEGSTLFLTGFPENTSDREMENFCRFLPGFVGAKSKFKTWPQVFVRFDSTANAMAAKMMIDRQPFDLQDDSVALKAHVAKTELINPGVGLQFRKGTGPNLLMGRMNSVLGIQTTVAPAALTHGHEGGKGDYKNDYKNDYKSDYKHEYKTDYKTDYGVWDSPRATKRGRVDALDADMDTIIIMGVQEKGYTEESLRTFFGSIPGYVTLQISKGAGHCFVKFSSHEAAVAALETSSNLEPQMARRSLTLDSPREPIPAETPRGSWGASQGASAGKGKGSTHQMEDAGDTLCIMGVGDQGLTESALGHFYEQIDGFLGLRLAPGGRGGGLCFVRFKSSADAQAALQATQSQGLDVQMAKTSLNPSQATYKAVNIVM
eukprot:TRINITY_DN67280_c0_g1_i1.p1 TRINITY_DN67280_c0_g1~~TRINITY_DN67280_c0_g1_i1.p1  ORF type:complete len:403 (-),score=56.67 TRINITY_DN67280_c0_g1_i1:156-1301(-)